MAGASDTLSAGLTGLWVLWLVYAIGDTRALLENNNSNSNSNSQGNGDGSDPDFLSADMGTGMVGGAVHAGIGVAHGSGGGAKLRLYRRMRRSVVCYSGLAALVVVASLVPRALPELASAAPPTPGEVRV